MNVWLVVTLVLFGLAGYCSAVLSRLLREDHPETFRKLGEPGFVPKSLTSPQWPALRFVWLGEYRALDDPRVTRACRFIHAITVVFLLWVFGPFFLNALLRLAGE